MGGSSSKQPAPAAPAPEPKKEEKKEFRYGWEDRNYGGIYKQKNATLQRQESSMPDEMAIWRLEARSLRLMEVFEDANAAMAMRPEPNPVRIPEGLDLNKCVGQACHRHCIELWSAYARCLDKKKKSGDPHAACTGWYKTYTKCFDECGPRLVLSTLETMAAIDPDPNMERLGK